MDKRFNAKKILIILSGTVLLLLITASLFFQDEFTDLKLLKLQQFQKNEMGGVVKNKTPQNIKVTEWRLSKVIPPPGKSSKDVGIKDVDGIIIEIPTEFEDRVFPYGVKKICDLSEVTIEKTPNNQNKITTSFLHHFCKPFSNVGWYNTLKEAFPYYQESQGY